MEPAGRVVAHGRQAPAALRDAWALGHRRPTLRTDPQPRRGWVYLHVVIDDHSRYLYAEQHDHEDAETNARTLQRALAHFAELGLPAPRAVMTDNALVYTRSARFGELLAQIGARHITPPPYTPRWNGKNRARHPHPQDEWAYAHQWPSSHHRAKALRSFIR